MCFGSIYTQKGGLPALKTAKSAACTPRLAHFGNAYIDPVLIIIVFFINSYIHPTCRARLTVSLMVLMKMRASRMMMKPCCPVCPHFLGACCFCSVPPQFFGFFHRQVLSYICLIAAICRSAVKFQSARRGARLSYRHIALYFQGSFNNLSLLAMAD